MTGGAPVFAVPYQQYQPQPMPARLPAPPKRQAALPVPAPTKLRGQMPEEPRKIEMPPPATLGVPLHAPLAMPSPAALGVPTK